MGLESYDRGLVDVVRVLGNHDACDTETDRPSEVKKVKSHVRILRS